MDKVVELVSGGSVIQDHNKGFINLRFLHKLNWMKTEWDQARFSSLV